MAHTLSSKLNQSPGLAKTILLTWLLAGTLDITGASIHYIIVTGRNPVRILYYISSAIFGKEALTGSSGMAVLGLALHYFVAGFFTVFYFLIFPKIKLLSLNKYITAVVIGLFTWCVMNLVVVPLSNTAKFPFKLNSVLINMGILIIAIGLPVSLVANWYYARKNMSNFGS